MAGNPYTGDGVGTKEDKALWSHMSAQEKAKYGGDRSTFVYERNKPAQSNIENVHDNSIAEAMIGGTYSDVNNQLRSEIGFDGGEAYFEAYLGTVKTAIANIFGTINNYSLSRLGSFVLGSHELGSVLFGSTRIDEINSIQDFTETFSTQTYRDALTNANWNTFDGRLYFGTGGSYSPGSTGGSQVSHYEFNGNLLDSNGSFNGSASIGSYMIGSMTAEAGTHITVQPGIFGSCFVFPGSKQISVPIQPHLVVGSSFTITAWWKRNNTLGSDGGLMSMVDYSGGSGWRILTTASGLISIDRIPGGDGDAGPAGTMYSINTWYHTAWQFNHLGSYLQVRSYLNGSQISSTTIGASAVTFYQNYAATGSSFKLAPTSTARWLGSMQDIRIYNRFLSGGEIQGIYNNGSGILGSPEEDLILGWHCNEFISGSYVMDYSGSYAITTGKYGSAFHITNNNQRFSVPTKGTGSGLGSEGYVGFWFKPRDTFSNIYGSATTRTLWTSYLSGSANANLALHGEDFVTGKKTGSLCFTMDCPGGSVQLYYSPGSNNSTLLTGLGDFWAMNDSLESVYKTNTNLKSHNISGVKNNPGGVNGGSCWTTSGSYGSYIELRAHEQKPLQTGSSFTLSLWFKFNIDALDAGSNYMIFEKLAAPSHVENRLDDGDVAGYRIDYLDTGSLFISPRSPVASETDADMSIALTNPGSWNHIVIKFDSVGGSVEAYLNGTLGSFVYGINGSTYFDYKRGGFGLGTRYFSITADNPVFPGSYNQMGYWTRTLTSSEITALYGGGSGIDVGSTFKPGHFLRNEYQHVWVTWKAGGSCVMFVNGSPAAFAPVGSTFHILGSYTFAGGQVDTDYITSGMGSVGSRFIFDDIVTGSIYDTSTPGLITGYTGSVAVISSWKSGSYQLSEFNRVRMDPTIIAYGSPTMFEMSFNGGSNYTQITYAQEKTGSPVGSDFRLRITDPSGSTILDKIDIITKGTNFN